jgi:membrane fusion protein (multidrug efflux system)
MKRLLLLTSLTFLLSACSDNATGGKQRDEARPLQVEIASVTRQSLGQRITRTGSLRAEREVKLITEEEGRIAELPYYEGDRVEKGTLLVQLDDTQLRAELQKARAQRRQAELDLRRLEKLQHSKVIAEDELARARTALDVALAEEELLRIRLSNTRINAPFAGVISRRLAESGDAVAKFTHLLTLSATDTLLAEIAVSELLLPGLAVNDPVSIRLDALGDRSFAGQILRIHPTVDPVTRQGIIEIRLSEPPAGAKPGQLCRVKLKLRPRPRLTVPFSALRRDTQGEYVFRLDDQDAVRRTAVVSGSHLESAVEIVDGLQEGARVVSKGFLGLADGMQVSVAGSQPAPAQP